MSNPERLRRRPPDPDRRPVRTAVDQEDCKVPRSLPGTPHPNPPPQGGRERETVGSLLPPSPLVGEGWGGGSSRRPATRLCNPPGPLIEALA